MDERERFELKKRMDEIKYNRGMEIPSAIAKVSNNFTKELIDTLKPFIERGEFENNKPEFVNVVLTCLSLMVSKEIIRLVKANFFNKEILTVIFAERLSAAFKAEELREKYPEIFMDH